MTVDIRNLTSPAGAIPSLELSAVTCTGSGSEAFFSMKKIPLTQGKFALVDDEDFDKLVKFKWQLNRNIGVDLEYAARNVVLESGRTKVFMHRIIMGASRKELIDHRDLNGLNNQKYNLRVCTHSQNLQNRRYGKKTKGGYKGVYYIGTKGTPWRAQIKVGGRSIVLGTYRTSREAAMEYNRFATQHFGQFARPNPI